ncbi:hypothetical protein [Chryseobacterium fistulae]|uniref:Uncharacterized protein n=1 Tax=Chryseobacterium fistulae TaxID=2675058 RepID=A0A6N4XZ32_9FLAO|nr:hypothetical protein [Chryseobacterium fistulae]CAA7392656.1 hypothetical protein CHRY9393_03382 [Chryseobacterium fistulae]
MTIKTILSQETPDATECYKHWIFWMTYEQSAYRIWQLKKYKSSYKYIKYFRQGVISVGFTDIGLEDVMSSLPPCGKIIQEPGYVKIPVAEDRECGDFIRWKESFREKNTGQVIEKRLLAFPLEKKSPMEAYVFFQKTTIRADKALFYPSILYMTSTQLPAYKAGYDLLLDLYALTKQMDRDYKFTLGKK